MTRAIFFDLDGTLCQPATPFAEVFVASLAPLLTAHPAVGEVALLAAWVVALEQPGPSTTVGCLARAFADCGVVAPDQRLLRSCAATLNREWAAAQRPSLDLWPTLAALQARFTLGIITNGPDDAQRAAIAAIAALGAFDYFQWIVVSGDPAVGVRKPDPAIFRRALSLAQTEPAATWYVGDSAINDIGGAIGAGMRACWLAPTSATLPDGTPPPEVRIASLGELVVAIRERTKSQPAKNGGRW